jgi:glycosyltransferase involved in cell wall biosynthesis
LRSQVRELGLEQVVSFLGFVSKEELADEYANCDIFVLPAIVDSKGDTEGLGVVLIEALAYAKPVVATNVGGIPDVITSGQTGQLVPEKDVRSLAHAILSVLANPELFAEMGLKGLEDIQTRFSWESIVPMWDRVFIDALDNIRIVESVESRTTDDRVDSSVESSNSQISRQTEVAYRSK